MNKTWSALVIAAVSGFILVVLGYQDTRTPNAVTWEPATIDGQKIERADDLVIQEEADGVIWASSGFSVYRSEGARGFLKVHTANPPPGLILAAYSGRMRSLLGLEETIEVLPIGPDLLLIMVGGEIRRVDLEAGTTEVVHRLRYYGHGEGRGIMPFGITVDDEGRIYYGEYVTRRLEEGETVALFRSDDQGRSFEIVYEFPAIVVRHIHAVQWDPYGKVLWMGTGDGDEQSRVGFSKDLGETFVWVGQDHQDFRTVGFVFAEDHVSWLSDTIQVPSRALRWHRDNWEIQTSTRHLPGHGQYIQAIGDGFTIGTTGEEAATMWLISDELGMEQIMEWPLSEGGMSGFSTIRLARGHRPDSDWLYFSPLRVRNERPAIYRMPREEAFAAAGVEVPGERHLLSQDDR